MGLETIDEQRYEETVAAKGIAVVEFGSVWCPPCNRLIPILEEIAADYGDDVRIVKVDVEQSPELASSFGVMGTPTVIVFQDGVPVDKLVGLRPRLAYTTVIDRLRAG